MAYPIKFKLIDRQTGLPVKGDKCPMLTPDGQPAIMEKDFYTYVNFVSCKDYELHVAIEKDDNGKWIYRQVGH